MMSLRASLVDTEGGRNVLYDNQWLYPQADPKSVAELRAKGLLFQESTLLIIESPLLSLGIDGLDARWRNHCLSMEYDTDLLKISSTPSWLSLIDGNDHDGLLNRVSEFFDRSLYRKMIFLSASGGRRLHQAKYVEIEATLNEYLRTYWRNRSTIRFHVRRWTRNMIENLSAGYDTLGQIRCEKPLVVVGAGPSLIKNLDWLKRLMPKLCIVCADTALKTLLKAEIEPDFVVLLEGQWFTIEDFPKRVPQKTTIIADWTAHAPTLRYLAQEGARIALVASLFYQGSTVNDLVQRSGLFGVPALGSVGVLTLYLAARLFEGGACAVVGLDFKNDAMLSHAIHSPRHDVYLNSNSRLRGLIGACHSFSGPDMVLESYANIAKSVLKAFSKPWFDLRGMGLDLDMENSSHGQFEELTETGSAKGPVVGFRASRGLQLLQDISKKISNPGEADAALINLLCMDFNFEPEEETSHKVNIRINELLDLINRHRPS